MSSLGSPTTDASVVCFCTTGERKEKPNSQKGKKRISYSLIAKRGTCVRSAKKKRKKK